jgi:hypothetical protein
MTRRLYDLQVLFAAKPHGSAPFIIIKSIEQKDAMRIAKSNFAIACDSIDNIKPKTF